MTVEAPGSKRVLIVDDEPKFCQLVSKFLQTRGYEVAVAGTGTDALLQLDRFIPEVILLDQRMPGLTGLEVLKLVQSRFCAPRIVMISAMDPNDVGQEALQLGANAYMCKPINLHELERVISGVWPSPSSAETHSA